MQGDLHQAPEFQFLSLRNHFLFWSAGKTASHALQTPQQWGPRRNAAPQIHMWVPLHSPSKLRKAEAKLDRRPEFTSAAAKRPQGATPAERSPDTLPRRPSASSDDVATPLSPRGLQFWQPGATGLCLSNPERASHRGMRPARTHLELATLQGKSLSPRPPLRAWETIALPRAFFPGTPDGTQWHRCQKNNLVKI